MTEATLTPFSAVYGPVQSWRFGRSLGIDPIGSTSTCSFNCVYCQLGEIEHLSRDRQLFIPTKQIQAELQIHLRRLSTFSVDPTSDARLDAITLSGSGEPTLALNLGEILAMVRQLTDVPVGVLTNGSLLMNPDVQEELAIAHQVAVKIDAISADQLRRINRPVEGIHLVELWAGLRTFRQQYRGSLAIQTMLLSPWNDAEQQAYLHLMQTLCPDEIQLNTPTRPKPLIHQLDGRGNHELGDRAYPTRMLKAVDPIELKAFGDRLQTALGIPVRYPQRTLLSQFQEHR